MSVYDGTSIVRLSKFRQQQRLEHHHLFGESATITGLVRTPTVVVAAGVPTTTTNNSNYREYFYIFSYYFTVMYTSRLINHSLTINRFHIHTCYKKTQIQTQWGYHSDDSNIEQVPAAAATTAASNVHTNEPVVVDDDATISDGFVNHRTQNGSTSSMNEQETEGTYYYYSST